MPTHYFIPFVRPRDYEKCWMGDKEACKRILIERELNEALNQAFASYFEGGPIQMPQGYGLWENMPPIPNPIVDPLALTEILEFVKVLATERVLKSDGMPELRAAVRRDIAISLHKAAASLEAGGGVMSKGT